MATMNDAVPKRTSFGCSIRSLLLLTAVCAAFFANVGTIVRVVGDGDDWELDTLDFVVFGALVLLPLCGLLVGHIRFHQVRYVILGGCIGFATGLLLLAVLTIHEAARPLLIASTAVPTVGLIAYGFYVRRRKT